MNWIEVVLEVPFEKTNAFSDALIDAGALSVTVEDADEGTPQEKPLYLYETDKILEQELKGVANGY